MTDTPEKERPHYQFQPGNPGGPGEPPSVPTPDDIRQAKHVCRLGATDQELATILGRDVATVKRWMITDEAFSHACKVGGDLADARVERGLYSRAVGTTRKGVREQVTKDGDVIDLHWSEEVLPDVAAASRWLEARKRKDWGVKSVVDVQGDLEVRDSRSALGAAVARALKAKLAGTKAAQPEASDEPQ